MGVCMYIFCLYLCICNLLTQFLFWKSAIRAWDSDEDNAKPAMPWRTDRLTMQLRKSIRYCRNGTNPFTSRVAYKNPLKMNSFMTPYFNKWSDRSMEVQLSCFLGNYDRERPKKWWWGGGGEGPSFSGCPTGYPVRDDWERIMEYMWSL